ncbi:MAG: hypothetical protein K1X92_06580 [Bacteroidia bacterium]|nr:hypothetical protein [Bacteroidia bacterium]
MVKNKSYIKILVGITIFAIIFHLLILIRLIPYEITWGGRLKTVEEMYVFEGVSILINSFYVFILLQKGDFISLFLSKKTITFILWIFFAVFTLNTVGNLLARTTFEKLFAILTLVNAFLIWRINTTKK